MKLNLGCGRRPLEGWVNLDLAALPGVGVVCDLEEARLPFADDACEELQALHVIEHIRNLFPLMEELWRVAAPGAPFTIKVPHGGHDNAWENPTHVRALFPPSFLFYSGTCFWRDAYDYRGDWQLEAVHLAMDVNRFGGKTTDELAWAVVNLRNSVEEMTVTLRAVKPARGPAAMAEPLGVTIDLVPPPSPQPP